MTGCGLPARPFESTMGGKGPLCAAARILDVSKKAVTRYGLQRHRRSDLDNALPDTPAPSALEG